MRTVGSLQELGEMLGRGRANLHPVSRQPKKCDRECDGSVYKVYDAVRDISTTAAWHPGILCSREQRHAYFSMGTDFYGINYFYVSEYFEIDPTQENGLKKKTGFRKEPEKISEELVPSLPTIGHLDDQDCRFCMGNIGDGRPSNW